MILSFRHKSLRLFFETGNRKGVRADQADRIERVLARLNEAVLIDHMALPGWRLHALRGDMVGFWSISISGNWRIVFRFSDEHASDVDLVDYH